MTPATTTPVRAIRAPHSYVSPHTVGEVQRAQTSQGKGGDEEEEDIQDSSFHRQATKLAHRIAPRSDNKGDNDSGQDADEEKFDESENNGQHEGADRDDERDSAEAQHPLHHPYHHQVHFRPSFERHQADHMQQHLSHPLNHQQHHHQHSFPSHSQHPSYPPHYPHAYPHSQERQLLHQPQATHQHHHLPFTHSPQLRNSQPLLIPSDPNSLIDLKSHKPSNSNSTPSSSSSSRYPILIRPNGPTDPNSNSSSSSSEVSYEVRNAAVQVMQNLHKVLDSQQNQYQHNHRHQEYQQLQQLASFEEHHRRQYQHQQQYLQRDPKNSPPATRIQKDKDSHIAKPRKKRVARLEAPKEIYCRMCGGLESTEWRRGPDGLRSLCNACGLRFAAMVKKESFIPSQDPPLLNKASISFFLQGATGQESSNESDLKATNSSGLSSTSPPLSSPDSSPSLQSESSSSSPAFSEQGSSSSTSS